MIARPLPFLSWMFSNTGSAVATWLSAILSLAAIVIALVAIWDTKRLAVAEALRDQRQAAAEEQKRDLQRRNEKARLARLASEYLGRSLQVLSITDHVAEGALDFGAGGLTGYDNAHTTLKAIIEVLTSLRAIAGFDPDIAIAISESSILLGEIVRLISASTSIKIGDLRPHLVTCSMEIKLQRHVLFKLC